MPLFEYRCTACGRQFEAFVTSSRKASCPACQSDQLEKQVSRLGRISGGGHDDVPVFSGG